MARPSKGGLFLLRMTQIFGYRISCIVRFILENLSKCKTSVFAFRFSFFIFHFAFY